MNMRHLVIASLALAVIGVLVIEKRASATKAAVVTAIKQRVEERWQLRLKGDLENEFKYTDPDVLAEQNQVFPFGARRASFDFSDATIQNIAVGDGAAQVSVRYKWEPTNFFVAALATTDTDKTIDMIEHWRWVAGDATHPANWYLVTTDRPAAPR